MDDDHRLNRAARNQRLAHLEEEGAALREMLDDVRARQRAEDSLKPEPEKKPRRRAAAA
jgi:hypothetical protein